MSFDISWVRSQFPSLQRKIGTRSAIFFDGPGGTQVPDRVIVGISNYLRHNNANNGGQFATSEATDAVIEQAHQCAANLLGAQPDEIVFGANMTSLTFALSRVLAKEITAGEQVIVTRLDHDANVAPWMSLSESGAEIRFVDINVADCTLDLDDLKKALTERKTRLVAVCYASNSVGTINDVKQVVELAHAAGALCFVDAVAYAPHGPIDVVDLDCDFLACSAYKFFGPHLGILYGKRKHLENLAPYKVRPATNELPYRWETGTQNHEGLAGLIAAIDYLSELGERTGERKDACQRAKLLAAMKSIRAYETELVRKLLERLSEIPDVSLYGITDMQKLQWRVPTVSVRLRGMHPEDVSKKLGEQAIFTWHGNYYAINLSERLGVESDGGMVRIGLVHYNTLDEIETCANALKQLASSAVRV